MRGKDGGGGEPERESGCLYCQLFAFLKLSSKQQGYLYACLPFQRKHKFHASK